MGGGAGSGDKKFKFQKKGKGERSINNNKRIEDGMGEKGERVARLEKKEAGQLEEKEGHRGGEKGKSPRSKEKSSQYNPRRGEGLLVARNL